jgi:hypothetical protein
MIEDRSVAACSFLDEQGYVLFSKQEDLSCSFMCLPNVKKEAREKPRKYGNLTFKGGFQCISFVFSWYDIYEISSIDPKGVRRDEVFD